MQPVLVPKPCLAPKLPRFLRYVAAQAGKGFGKPAPLPKPAKDAKAGGEGKNVRRRQTQFIEDEGQGAERNDNQPFVAQQDVTQRFRQSSAAQQSEEAGQQDDFDRRVAQLAQSTPVRQQAVELESQQDVLAMEPQFGRTPAASVAEDKPNQEGSPWFVRAGAAVGALVLAVIFVASGIRGDFGGGGPVPAGGAAPQLTDEQRKDLEEQAKKFEEQLAASPENNEALESAAVSYARLGNFKKAAPLLERLSKAKADDPEVWRLLAETKSLQGDYKAAAAAYETANEKGGGGNIEILSAWTDTLLAGNQPQQAVDVVKAAKQRASSPEMAVDADLLLGRVYSRWKGHNADAFAIYDRLAESKPDDFRVPLAKGLMLKSEGRKGDAARYFMKARYLAPASARGAIEELVSRQDAQ